jgi:hypothetical protein
MKFFQAFRVLALVALLTIAAVAQDKPVQPSGTPAPSGAAPKLVIESYTHDFGEVKSGEPLRYAFKIKNEGNADLVINNVAPG